MYTRLNTNRTQAHYKEILDAVTTETELLKEKFPDLMMYKSILEQLLDIKKIIVDENKVLSEDDIYDRYSLGAIAVKNFSLESDEYAQKLSDAFGGIFDYYEMPKG
jgi:hypothetical protein